MEAEAAQRIQRVDRPDRELICLTVYRSRETSVAPAAEDEQRADEGGLGRSRVLLVSFGAIVGAGYVARRPRGGPADSLTQRLRRMLVGARVLGVEMNDECVRVALDVRGAPAELVASGTGLRLHTADDAFGVGPDVHPVLLEDLDAVSSASLDALGPVLVKSRASVHLEHTRRFVRTRLARALKRLTRKRLKIASDIARGERAASVRHDADLLLAHPHVEPAPHPSGGYVVQVTDWAVDPPAIRGVRLPEGTDPHGYAQRCYDQARRWERGALLVRPRLDALDETLVSIRDWLAEVTRSHDESRLLAVADAAAELGVREFREVHIEGHAGGKTRKRRPRLPYRIYESEGQAIWVGRGARDNDALTLRHARPHHLWLHVRGTPGAHVVVPIARKQKVSGEVLLDAATLASHFSDARGDVIVEVDHTTRGQVSKPKGAAAGAVKVRTARTLRLRFEAARLARLLASERTV